MRNDRDISAVLHLLDCLEYGFELLERAARKRGFVVSGGEADTERMSRILLDEFRGGKLGRFTLEMPE